VSVRGSAAAGCFRTTHVAIVRRPCGRAARRRGDRCNKGCPGSALPSR